MGLRAPLWETGSYQVAAACWQTRIHSQEQLSPIPGGYLSAKPTLTVLPGHCGLTGNWRQGIQLLRCYRLTSLGVEKVKSGGSGC